MPEKRFLVVRLGSLGDIVHTFPAVAALRESFPSARIIWLTHPRWVQLVDASSLATEIWPVDSRDLASVRRTLGKIRSQVWDAAIDYQGLWKSSLLPFLGGARTRIGFSSATVREYGVPILYTDRVLCHARHIAEQNGELSLRAGAARPVAKFALKVPASDETLVREQLAKEGATRFIVLSPGGGWCSKCWPTDRFGHLCQKIHDGLGVRCVINYGPGEDALASAVKAASGNSHPLVYDGDLGPLMALLRNACCIVGGDTGPLHLAVALGTPAVALFGPTNPARNGPFPSQEIVLRSSNAVTTYKRGDSTDPSFLDLSVDQVYEAVQRRLGVFRMTAADFFARWRVRLGYLLAIVVLLLARPSPRSILVGAAFGLLGLAIRAYAAGYLQKQEILTVSGPYAHTRNPLYFGSSLLALGAALAMHSWLVAVLLFVYFVLVYSFVMRREAGELGAKHGAAFEAYAASVPLFLPRLMASRGPASQVAGFSWKQYKKNHEYQAALGFFLLLVLLVIIWRMHTA